MDMVGSMPLPRASGNDPLQRGIGAAACDDRGMRLPTPLRLPVLLLAFAAAGACSSPGRSDSPSSGEVGALVRFEPLLATRSSCHGSGEGEAVLRDAASWRSFWASVSCGEGVAPPVDFSSSLVLAVTDREGPTGCYQVRIAEVRIGVGGGYLVVVNRHVPVHSTPCPMVVVHPAAAVAVPAQRGPVVFEWRTVEGPVTSEDAAR